ncbi:MAG: MoaD/ThiS family protein [Planctomycetota bacterium]
MITVRFPPHLKRFIDLPEEFSSDAESIPEILAQLESRFPGVSGYIVHENGSLRQHVNLFLDNRVVTDRESLSDDLTGVKELVIMQALSGG